MRKSIDLRATYRLHDASCRLDHCSILSCQAVAAFPNDKVYAPFECSPIQQGEGNAK